TCISEIYCRYDGKHHHSNPKSKNPTSPPSSPLISGSSSNWTFDFVRGNVGVLNVPNSRIVKANHQTFPVLDGRNLVVVYEYYDPCQLIVLHSHPFGDEFFYAVKGERMRVAFVDVTSGKLIVSEIREGQATLIPRGSIHYQQNLDCKPAVILSSFNSGNPGAILTFQSSFSNIPYDVIKESLGGGKMVNEELIEHIKAKVPNAIAVVNAECRKRCGLDKPMDHKRYE
ncbi:unnamed protein product, partial [Didymodactylos carnosus]